MKEHALIIEGMSCGHCVRAVEETLTDIEGIKVLKVEIGKAYIEEDPDAELSRSMLKEAIEEAGYALKE